jgi:hypothetical protein
MSHIEERLRGRTTAAQFDTYYSSGEGNSNFVVAWHQQKSTQTATSLWMLETLGDECK